MRKFIFLIFFTAFPFLICFGQNKHVNRFIIAVNKTTQQQYTIDYNSKVKVKLKDGIGVFKGGLAVVNDSSIAISGVQINLSEIASISTSKTAPKVVGGIFIGLGVVVGAIGIGTKNFAKTLPKGSLAYLIYNAAGNAYLIAGSSSTMLGIAIANAKRKYKAEKYHFSIVTI